MSKKITLSFLFTALALSVNAQEQIDIDNVLRYGNYDVAKKYYYDILKADPVNGQHYYDLGRIHLAQNQNDSAEIYFKEGLRAKINTTNNNLGIARLSLDNGSEKEALSKFNTILALNKKNTDQLQRDIANIYIYSKNPNPEKGIEFAKLAQKTNPKNLMSILIEGDAYLADGSKKLAEQKYKEVLKKDSKSIEARLRLAQIYKMENTFDKAIELYNEAIAIDPEYPAVYRDLALLYKDYAGFSNNRALVKNAVENYHKFYELVGPSLDIDNQYADFLVKVKDYETLTNLIQDTWITRGDNFEVYRYASIAAFEQGSTDNAYMFINKYFEVQDNPTKITAVDYFYLGISEVVKSVAGKEVNEALFNKGLQNMDKGIALDASLADDIYKKAFSLFQNEKFKEAYYVFDLGTKNENTKDYVSNQYYKGTALYMTQDNPIVANPLEKAITAFDEAIRVSPSAHEAYLMNARAHRNLGTDSARNNMAKNYEGFVNAVQSKGLLNEKSLESALLEAYMQLGDYYKVNDKQKAITYFEKALQINPNHDYSKNSLSQLQ